MNAKEYLKQYGRCVKECEMLKERINTLRDEYDLIGSGAGDGIGTGEPGNPTERKALRVAQLEERLTKAYEERLETESLIWKLILEVGGTESQLLANRYVYLKSWEQICVDMNYSWNGIHKKHRVALKRANEILNQRGY